MLIKGWAVFVMYTVIVLVYMYGMLIKGWAVFAIYTAIVLVCMYMYKNVC